MQIQTIPSALFSLRTCCALAWFGISQTHHEGSILASKGRCQSNSVVRPLALTLRRTGPLKCLLTVFQSLNSGIHTRRKRCQFRLGEILVTIRVLNVLQILHLQVYNNSLSYQALSQYRAVVGISDMLFGWEMTTLITTCSGRLSLRHIFDVFLGVLLHEHANVCQQLR